MLGLSGTPAAQQGQAVGPGRGPALPSRSPKLRSRRTSADSAATVSTSKPVEAWADQQGTAAAEPAPATEAPADIQASEQAGHTGSSSSSSSTSGEAAPVEPPAPEAEAQQQLVQPAPGQPAPAQPSSSSTPAPLPLHGAQSQQAQLAGPTAEQRAAFLQQSAGQYGYAGQIDALREHFPQLAGQVYVDHAGAALYSRRQLAAVFEVRHSMQKVLCRA